MDDAQKALDEYEMLYKNAFDAKKVYLNKALSDEALQILKRLNHKSVSDKDYKDIILPFWARYNKTPEKFWFSYYGSRDSVVNPLFIPANIYFCEILPYLNDLTFKYATQDKGGLPERLPNIKQAKTIARRMSGLYYDGKMNMISKEKAIDLCLSHNNKIVIKPSLFTSTSRGISVINPAETKRDELEKTLEEAGVNYIVQDKITQHPDLAKLNPSTTNTIRVNSFLSDEGVYIASSSLRVGSADQEIVERGLNDWLCEINDDNTIGGKTINLTRFDYDDDPDSRVSWKECPCPAVDSTYIIPSMDKVRNTVKKAHPMLPHFRWIGWDFTVDEDGDPVLIEINLTSGQSWQLVTCKPMFGDMTQYILDDYYIHRTMEKNHRQDRLFE